ncbi:MAG: flagellar hook-associated protein FlgK [Vicinamibacterales bacterium]|nr:flagellar hook-associated protein FlgK [Vicinamibacterales bacterium]
MSLFGSLTSASRALEAQRFGLDVTGQNIANINTPGYTRREVDFAAVAPADRMSAGGGVNATGIRTIRDAMLERRFRQELPDERRQAAIAETLSLVEVALGGPGRSLDAQLTAFFDGWARLAEDPLSATARQAVVQQGQTMAASVRDLAGRLSLAERDTNVRVGAGVSDINGLVTRIAALNQSIASVGGGNAGQTATLRDQQGEELRKLAGLVGVEVLTRADGGVDVSFAGGRPLVIGHIGYAVEAVPAAGTGLIQIHSGGVDVTAAVTAGTLGGLLHTRDTLIPGYKSDLDTLAHTLATEINALHSAGFDRAGVAAGNFFEPPAAVAGAAAGLRVEAALIADPSRVAAAAVASPGDNAQARAMANLRDGLVMNGGTATLHDGWGNLLYRVGADTQAARFEQRTRAEIVRQIENLRDGISGVSLDEEAMRMLKFQRAYEANARFFRAIDESIDVLLSLKR